MSSQSFHDNEKDDSSEMATCVAPPDDQDFEDNHSDLPIIAAVYSLAQEDNKPTLLPKPSIKKTTDGTTSSQNDSALSQNGTVLSQNGTPSGTTSLQGMASMTSMFEVVQSTPIQCAKNQVVSKPQLIAPASKSQSSSKSYTPIMPKPQASPKILVPVNLPAGALPVSSNGMVVLNSNHPLLCQLPSGTILQLAQAPKTTSPSSAMTSSITPTIQTTNSNGANQTVVKAETTVVSSTTKTRTSPRNHKSVSTAPPVNGIRHDKDSPTITSPPTGSVENPVAYINSVFSKKKMALKIPTEHSTNNKAAEMCSQESTASQVLSSLNAHEQRIQKLKELLKQQEAALEKIRSKRKLESDNILEELDTEETFKRPRTDLPGSSPKASNAPNIASSSQTLKPIVPKATVSLTKSMTTVGSVQSGNVQLKPVSVVQNILLPANPVLSQPGTKLIPANTVLSQPGTKLIPANTVLSQPGTKLMPANTVLSQPGTKLVPINKLPVVASVKTILLKSPNQVLQPATHKPVSLRPMNIKTTTLKPPLKPKASQIKLSLPKKMPTKSEESQPKKFIPSSSDDGFLRLLGLERVVDRLKTA